jgi:beta-galactosidase
LARYEHPHFGQWPTITTTPHGKGRITYVGTVPNQQLAQALFRWLAPKQISGWRTPAESVTSSSATARDGRRVRFLHNWSWQPTTVRIPVRVRDVLDGHELAVGDELSLGSWDVRVLVEH